MRKSKYFLFLFVFCSAITFSQNKKTDSLLSVLNKTKNDIDKAQLYNAIADEFKTSDSKKMVQYANSALQLSQKINYKLAEGNAYLNIGVANIITGNYTISLDNFSKAQTIFEKELEINPTKTELKSGLARAYGSIGIVFSEQSSYGKALKYQLKSLKIYEELKNFQKCAQMDNNIGVIYKSQDNNFRALEYFTKCLKIQEQLKDETIGITITNIGNIYLNEKNYPKAIENYNKAQQLFDKNPNMRGLGELQNNIGLYFKENNNANLALENFNKAIKSFTAIDDKFGISDTYFYISDIYFNQNKLSEALVYVNESLVLAKELDVIEQVKNCEKRLSDIYEKQNNTSEFIKHFKLYSSAKDSVSSAKNIENSVRAEMNFEFDKKEALQKKELEKQSILYDEQSKRHSMQLFFAVLISLLLAGIGFLIYNRLQLKKTLTLQKELAEYEQKALHLQMNPHFVFNCLGSISSFIAQNGTDIAIKYLAKFSKLMRLTLEYSKESLIPIDKEIESLQNYLELEQLRFNKKFDFIIKKSIEIEDDVALPPLLLQPFVENAIIHGLIPKAEKGKININFRIENESLLCTIEDDGIGFDKSKELKESLISAHKSMALDITKKRLEMIETTSAQKAKVEILEIKNDAGTILGTKVVLNLPIQYIK